MAFGMRYSGREEMVLRNRCFGSDVEKAAEHLAPEVSNLVKLQPVDINNLQFVLC